MADSAAPWNAMWAEDTPLEEEVQASGLGQQKSEEAENLAEPQWTAEADREPWKNLWGSLLSLPA